MSNRKTVSRIAFASLALVIISSVTFASPWSAAMDWLGFGEAPAAVETAPEAAMMTIGACDTAGPIEVEASLTGLGPTPYATLGLAFTAINNGLHTGAISIEVCGDTTEAASAVLNASGSGSASYSVIIMRPSGGAARTISGSVAAPLIDLNGADNVTINGINAGGDSLTIDNTLSAATPSTIRFIGDATGNTIQNSTIKGASTATTLGTIFFSTGTTTGNDTNIINANTITSSGANFATNAIYSLGTSAAIDNSGISITNNNISDYFNAASATVGINVGATGNSAWTITGNKLFQTANRSYTTANTHNGIAVLTGSGYTINSNVIGFANSAGTGTTNMLGVGTLVVTGTFPSAYTISGTSNATRYIGINAAFTAAGAASNIQGNTVGGFALITSSGAATTNGVWCGINVTSGNANIGTTTGNTIGATSGLSSVYTATTTTGAQTVGIYATSVNTVAIQNNTIGGIDAVGTTATLAGGITAIDTAGSGGLFTINSNNIGNTTADNIRTGYTLSGANLSNAGALTSTTGATAFLTGIRNSATGATLSMNSNTLRGWATSGTVTAVTGITSTGANTTSIGISTNAVGTSGLGWMRYAVANSGTLTGINASGISAAAGLTITTNDVRGIVHSVAGTNSQNYISWTHAQSVTDNINNNTFTNLNVSTTGSVQFLAGGSSSMTATGVENCNNNSIVTAFNKTGSSGTDVVNFYNRAGSSVTGSSMMQTGNNFSNVTVNSTTAIQGWLNQEGSSSTSGPSKTITGNTFSNIAGGSGALTALQQTFAGPGTVNVSNNIISTITGTGSITGMSVGGSSTGAQTYSSNSVTSLISSGTGGAVTGIAGAPNAGGGSATFGSNTINTLSSTGASSAVSGVALTAGVTATVTGNTINTLSSTGATAPVISGVSASSGTTINISKNKIYDLSGNQAATLVNGLNLTAGTTLNISNNLIGDLRATAATGLNSIIGINANAASTFNVFHNTVYLNSTSSSVTTFGTSCITFASTATTLNLRNNILVNLSTPAQNGTNVATNGVAATLRRSTGTAATVPANYNTASNQNDFWVNPTAGTNNHATYIEGTSTITNNMNTFAQMKTFMVNRDQASFGEDINSPTPKFLSTSGASANFLHIDTTVATQIESGGGPGTGIADDFDGNARSGSTPDVGADEFAGIGIDLTAPAISYTLLGNGATGATRSFTNVTITDATGVNGTAGTRPRVYYKKSTDTNTFNDNTSATAGWKFVEASGGTSPFSFTIDYSKLSGGAGVSVADVIQYFVVAQDTAAPTVGINSGTFTAQPTSVALTAAAFPIGGTINAYTIAPAIAGTKTVCATGCDYTTLTGAAGIFNAINTSVATGNISIEVAGDLIVGETGAVALNVVAEDPVGNYTVNLYPTGTTRTISGPTASNGLIRLNGVDRVTIDGSIGGTGTDRSLTITNTSPTSPTAVSLVSLGTGAGATNNTVKNCNISTGVSAATGYGIAVGGSTPGTSGADNDTTTLQNNSITLATVGIYANGTASVTTGGNDNLAITGNSVDYNGTLGSIGLQVGNALNSSVSQNTVSEQTSATQSPTGISLETGFVSSSVTRNIVTKALTTNTGGYGGRGITIGTGTASSALTLANNVVYGVNGSDFSGFSNSSSMGIAIGVIGNSTTITTTAGGINLYFNSVRMTGTIGSNSTSAITTALYVGSGASALDLRNNVFANTMTGISTTQKNYAIFSAAANTAFTTINYNDYYVSNSFNAASAIPGNIAATDRTNLAGIQTGFGQNVNSLVADPLFNSPTNLAPQTGSPIVGAGIAGTGVTIDFLGAARGATPTMGAYENATDTAGPVIAYSALTNTVSTGDRTLSITVTDTSGVPSSGIGLPVIYYRKNAGGYVNTQCVFVSGSSFNCDLVAASMGGLTTGDTVSYYVAAQDNLGNVSVNPSAGASGLTANPPAAATPPTTPNSYLIATAVTGTYSVNSGGGGDALSLTNTGGIFQTINNGVVTGNVTINIDSDLTAETGTVALNQFASPFTVTIKPNGAPRTITGTGSGGILIKLNGADNVTIDGSTSGGTDRSLTLINPNTATGTGTLFVASLGTGAGATNDTIKNCIIKAGSIGSASVFNFGIFVGDTTGAAAGADNDNLTIQNNQIFTARTGIQATGAAGGVLDNLNINGNLIGDNTPANSIGRIGMTLSTLNNASVSGNTIKNISIAADTSSSFGIVMTTTTGSSIASNTITGITATGTSVLQPTGISVSTATTGLSITGNTIDGIVNSGSNVGPQGITVGAAVTNSSVTRNNVSNINYTGTGGYGGKGIEIGTGSASSNLTVANNFVSNIRGDCWSAGSNILDTVMGIRVVGATGGVNIYNNSVNLASGSFAGNTQPATISAALYIASTATTLNVRNNILTNNLDNTAETSDKNYAFYSDAANTAFTDINFNDYWVPASSAAGPQVLGFLTTDRVLLTDIQTATGKDAASISGNPLFATVTDLHIASGSPARNTGTTIAAVTDDYDGNARPQEAVYDIGADEYVDGIAPDTSIDSNPTNPSSSASATFTFSGTDSLAPEAVASFECDLDGGGFATCTSPQNYPSLSDGSHTFQVRAKDAGGNVDPTPASYTWVIDATAPDTSITANPTNPTNSANASFSFTGNDGSGTGIASFQCQIDGGGFSTCTSPANYPGLSDGSHTFQVRATDNVGNTDPTPASYTWVIDTIAPDTNITANPTNPTNSASASFSFTGSDPGGSGVASFQCQLDGGGYSTCTSPANYPGLTDGSHTFQVRAVDAAGNTDATPASYTWVVDATAPNTSITANPTNPTNSASASFSFTGNDGAGTGVASFQCQIDGGGYSTCASPANYPGLTDGSHTFQVRAIDGAGNTDASPASYTWVVDATAPDTNITANPTNPSNSASASFSFTGSDPGGSGVASFQCQLDGGGYSTCTSPANYPGLSDGSHTFQVRAIDSAGNTDATPASYTWVVDATAPDTSITANPTNPTNSASASFSFTGNDGSGTGVASFQCQLDGGGYSTCTSPANYPGLTDGSHTFQVRAVDGAGNTDASPASYTWLVDTTPPSTTILTMPANPTNSTTATFTFSGNDGSGSGVASFSCQIDAGGYAPCTSGISYPGLAAGAHVFDVRAIDNAGNSNPAVQTYIWTIDLTAPVIGAYTPLSNTSSLGARSITVTVTDNLALAAVDIHYSINGGSYLIAACSPAGPPNEWTCTLPGNPAGTAVAYYVSATDTATNSASSPLSSAPNLYTVGAAAVPAGTYSVLSMRDGSSLGGNVTVVSSLELSGIITTGVNTITLNCGAVIEGAGPASYINGNLLVNFCATGAFTFPVGSTPDGLRPDSAEPEGFAGEYSPMTATITALGVNPSSLKVSVDDNFMLGMVQTSAISRNWSVEETGNITADMTFKYLDQDINGPESGYKVFKRSGGFTTEVTPNSNNPAANTVTVLNVSNFSQWTAGAAFTTAAGASISGRVTTASGNGIRNAYVTISGNSLPAPIRIQTGSLGWYHFENLAAGETYIIQVGAKRFRFAAPSRVIALQDSLSDVDFVANPPE